MVDVSSQSRAWKRLSRSRSAWIGTTIVLALVLMALAADWVSPYGPQERAAVGSHAAPSAEKRRRPRRAGLMTLDEWNAERKAIWSRPSPSDDEPNGIACPHCGEETLDRSPGKMLDGSPPRMEIHCNSECGFVGRRIA